MRALLIMLAAAVVASGCGGSEGATTAPASRRVVELANLDPVVQRFEADRGKPHLIVIFSPT